MQVFMVTGLFAGQHNTKLHGTNAGVIYTIVIFPPRPDTSLSHFSPKMGLFLLCITTGICEGIYSI